MGDPSNEKGRSLEDAVALIEKTILETDPDLANRPMRIDLRKRVVVDDVPHEIDLWVELSGPHGYDSLFVFECKNWSDKVGKNEVIVLSEKVNAVQAQRGYLVAHDFTAGARAQAAKDPRVRLLEVREDEYEWLTSPLTLNYCDVALGDVSLVLGVSDQAQAGVRFDFATVEGVLDGKPIDLKAYLEEWRHKVVTDTAKKFRSYDHPTGAYQIQGSDGRLFAPGALTINGVAVGALKITVRPVMRVAWPRLVSSVEVLGRGRVLQLEPIMIGGGAVRASVVTLATASDPSDKPLSAPKEYFVRLTTTPGYDADGACSRAACACLGQHMAGCAVHAPPAPCDCRTPASPA